MATPKKIENGSSEDLGLGVRVVEENRTRFVNPDGSFNVYRKGTLDHGSFSPYHAILSASWPNFYFKVMSAYLAGNLFFAALYLSLGRESFPAIGGEGAVARFGELFYYSIQVTTLAHSSLEPVTFIAKFFVSIEAIIGLLAFALGASLIMARFSNPATRILFSEKAVVAPYGEKTAFMARIVNRRNSELIEVRAVVTVALESKDGKREFHRLPLERDLVYVFPLSWTIVHPIMEGSPLYGLSEKDFSQRKVEFVITVSGVDQDLARPVYARRSYIPNEIAFGVRFKNILEHTDDGTIFVDPSRIHEIEPAARLLGK